MTDLKRAALDALNKQRVMGRISYDTYGLIFDGLNDVDTLKDRDNDMKELWEMFGDVPMNPETECMEEAFLGFPAGTHREEIWHWFDERYSKGVYALMYGGNGALYERLKAAEEVIGSAYGADGEYVDQLISRYWEKYCLKGRLRNAEN